MATLKRFFSIYGKSLVATAIAVVTVVHTALSDGHINPVEWLQIVIAVGTALLVYLIPLNPHWAGAKTTIATVLSVLNVVGTLVVADGWSGRWTELILAAATALGVAVAPAKSTVGAASRPEPLSPPRPVV